MKSWLRECRENHPYCSASHEPFAPKRLLDLGQTRNTRNLKLTQSQDIPSASPVYVTLSHCWGSNPELSMKTTTSNLEASMREILFASLPLTFQDAVQTTRDLGVRYLWIDSLCIIQDSPKDWEEEVAIMGQVYTRSLVTLTDAMSRNSDGGCRVKKDPTAKDNQPLDIVKGSKRIRIFARSPLDWNEAWNKGPLRKRAWTLQERQLSNGSLHFSENVLLWECQTSKASSELPWMQMKIEDPPPVLMLNDANENRVGSNSLAMREHWFSIVEDYSQRNLTRETDKLPALFGLVQTSAQSRGAYFAGLFRMDMPSALLWRSRLPYSHDEIQPQRPKRYRAPTWSWASVEGAIMYESQRLNEAVGTGKPGLVEHDFGSFTILDLAVEAAGADRFGAVLGGWIRLAGRLIASSTDIQVVNEQGWKALLDRSGERIGVIYPDVSSELGDSQDIFCLEVRKETYWSKIEMDYWIYNRYPEPEDEEDSRVMVMGLALVKDDEHAGGYSYKRVGLVRWMKGSCFSDAKVCEITIY